MVYNFQAWIWSYFPCFAGRLRSDRDAFDHDPRYMARFDPSTAELRGNDKTRRKNEKKLRAQLERMTIDKVTCLSLSLILTTYVE